MGGGAGASAGSLGTWRGSLTLRLALTRTPGAPSSSCPGTGPRRRSNFCARWRAPGLPGIGMGTTRWAPGGHCSSRLVGLWLGEGRWPLDVSLPRTESAILPFPDSRPNLGGHGHSGGGVSLIKPRTGAPRSGTPSCSLYLGGDSPSAEGSFSCPATLLSAAPSPEQPSNSRSRPKQDQSPPLIAPPGVWEPEGSRVGRLYK